MSVRIRRNGKTIVCAAESKSAEGDCYLNDHIHYALVVMKILRTNDKGKTWYFDITTKKKIKKCKSKAKEIIICAAIKFKCGLIIRGQRHGDCIRTTIERDFRTEHAGAIQGFITSQNRFVDRKEAMIIQKKAGILSAWQKEGYRGSILFSEDLY